jgi:UrcA family protein
MSTLIQSALLAMILVLTPGISMSDSGRTDQRTLKVSYADLDLSQPDGIRTLYVRIQGAASVLCGSTEATSGARPAAVDDECARNTISAAVYGARIPRLKVLHQTRTGLMGMR